MCLFLSEHKGALIYGMQSYLLQISHLQCRYFQLALLFLSEVKKGSASLWYPYIQSLPREFDPLEHWSNAELAELQYDSTKLEDQFIHEVLSACPVVCLRPK